MQTKDKKDKKDKKEKVSSRAMESAMVLRLFRNALANQGSIVGDLYWTMDQEEVKLGHIEHHPGFTELQPAISRLERRLSALLTGDKSLGDKNPILRISAEHGDPIDLSLESFDRCALDDEGGLFIRVGSEDREEGERAPLDLTMEGVIRIYKKDGSPLRRENVMIPMPEMLDIQRKEREAQAQRETVEKMQASLPSSLLATQHEKLDDSAWGLGGKSDTMRRVISAHDQVHEVPDRRKSLKANTGVLTEKQKVDRLEDRLKEVNDEGTDGLEVVSPADKAPEKAKDPIALERFSRTSLSSKEAKLDAFGRPESSSLDLLSPSSTSENRISGQNTIENDSKEDALSLVTTADSKQQIKRVPNKHDEVKVHLASESAMSKNTMNIIDENDDEDDEQPWHRVPQKKTSTSHSSTEAVVTAPTAESLNHDSATRHSEPFKAPSQESSSIESLDVQSILDEALKKVNQNIGKNLKELPISVGVTHKSEATKGAQAHLKTEDKTSAVDEEVIRQLVEAGAQKESIPSFVDVPPSTIEDSSVGVETDSTETSSTIEVEPLRHLQNDQAPVIPLAQLGPIKAIEPLKGISVLRETNANPLHHEEQEAKEPDSNMTKGTASDVQPATSKDTLQEVSSQPAVSMALKDTEASKAPTKPSFLPVSFETPSEGFDEIAFAVEPNDLTTILTALSAYEEFEARLIQKAGTRMRLAIAVPKGSLNLLNDLVAKFAKSGVMIRRAKGSQ